METNITFRIDADTKKQMAEICKTLGMTTSTAFNLFANAFVREQGMPFPVKIQERYSLTEDKTALGDAHKLLEEYAEDYRRLAE